MPKITFVSPNNEEVTLEGRVGDTAMEIAVKNGIKGIIAECGGACACATCHVYVDKEFIDASGAVSELEDDMLEGTASERTELSRLSCQLKLSEELDGIRVRIAPSQI